MTVPHSKQINMSEGGTGQQESNYNFKGKRPTIRSVNKEHTAAKSPPICFNSGLNQVSLTTGSAQCLEWAVFAEHFQHLPTTALHNYNHFTSSNFNWESSPGPKHRFLGCWPFTYRHAEPYFQVGLAESWNVIKAQVQQCPVCPWQFPSPGKQCLKALPVGELGAPPHLRAAAFQSQDFCTDTFGEQLCCPLVRTGNPKVPARAAGGIWW